jgi:hypothetical protein
VLASIDFDNEAMTNGNKICDERAYRSLPAEFVAGQPSVAERYPEAALGLRLIFSQSPRCFVGH